jgi:NADH-quinone oxidoreductase subunit L
METFAIQHSYLIPLLPLLGAAVAGFFGARWLRGQSHWPIWITVGLSALLSLVILWGMAEQWRAVPPPEEPGEPINATAQLTVIKHWYNWISAGDFTARAAFLIDPLTAVMLCVVCGIGFLITIFSKGYMVGDSGYFRFFAYLGLFIFAMTILVLGDNLVMLYLGWEGVGLCSYLLIGHYYDRPAAREAAKKAFLVNRIGDFGFGLGIMLIFLAFGTVSYFGDGVGTETGFLEMAVIAGTTGEGFTELQWIAVNWAPFLLMVGAFGKSAQFPLYVWLPDAMEGPSPVSALIHAATMVTAGVYMIVRCGPLFIGNEPAMWTVAIIGAFTAIFAATIALRQFDLKKVFAYSTISQLGFMFVGVGVLAPVTGIFHLVTHAFFKALLFLGSGVVMHAMLGELDMRKFSGLKRVLPVTRWLMLIGCLALAGFPLLSGFLSKDEIVIAAWDRSVLLGLVLLATAFLTAYYTFRLYFRVFEGPELVPAAEPTAPAHHGAHELHAHASEPAVATGTTAESGVDEHLMDEHHGSSSRGETVGHGHGHEHAHSHEPAGMMVPLIVLAVGAVLIGYINWPAHYLGEFLGQSPSVMQAWNLATWIYPHGTVAPVVFGQPEVDDPAVRDAVHAQHIRFMVLSGLIAVLGIYLAYLFHLHDRTRGERLAERFAGLSRLLEAKYWVDEIYQNVVVEPLRALGRAFFAMDRYVIDGLVWGVSFVPQLGGFALKLTTQRGYLQGYALSILFAVVVILLLVFL